MAHMSQLTAKQVAERTGLSLRTVKRYAHDGVLPVAGKVPYPTGAYLFDADAIDQWIADREVAA